MAKILLYDIETTPSLGYTWGKYDQTVLKFVKHRELLSVAYKWLGEDKIHVATRQDEKDDKFLAQLLQELMDKADIVVAHNGKQFDNKIIRARMIKHGLKPCKPSVTVDTRLSARAYFDFNGNSLADLGDFFNIGSKVPTPGIGLWLDCIENKDKAWKLMIKYNKHDVWLLEKVYEKLRPWIENHPNVARLLGKDGTEVCPNCSSNRTQKRGLSATAKMVQQRRQCQDCGKWFTTKYKKV